MNHDDVLRDRLARQRLTGRPAVSPVDAVRGLLGVQAQDAVTAQAMVALRSTGRVTDVQAAVDAGTVVRPHVLRPTWHYVAAEELAWLLALAGPKTEASAAARRWTVRSNRRRWRGASSGRGAGSGPPRPDPCPPWCCPSSTRRS